MVYARRDAKGRIEAVFRTKPRGRCECLAADDPDVQAFLSETLGTPGATDWSDADRAMARVVEDLVDTLIEKKLLSLTDLPLPAQQKLVSRHGKRHDLDYVARLYPATKDDDLG